MATRSNGGSVPEQTPRGGSTGPQSQPIPTEQPEMGTNDVPHAMKTTEKADKPGVYHISQATERRITEQDWAQAGVSGQGTVVWDGVNKHYRELEDFSPEALELLKRDSSFRIVESDSDDSSDDN